jgi:hypothetical protein
VIDDAQVAEAVHDSQVRRLQYAYADVVNRRAWPELEPLFMAGAPVVVDRRVGEPLRLEGASAVGEFIAGAIAQFEFFEFVILNAHIVFPRGPQAGEASSRLFMCELRQHRESGRMTTAYGLYHDRYLIDAARWRFAERRYHSLARDGRDLEAFPFPLDPGVDVSEGPT